MRLTDLQTTIELLIEANVNIDGARDRLAARHSIQKSVITDRVKRTEEFLGAQLFGGPQRKEPTKAGKFVGRYGHRLLDEIEFFAERVREEAEQQ